MKYFFALLVLCNVSFLPVWAAPPESIANSDYVADLLAKAREEKLYAERYWHILLHYRTSFFGGFVSEADGESFFLSPAGKTEPKEELLASLRSFFLIDSPGGDDNRHALCLFPARFRWLKKQLGIDPAKVPKKTCEKLQNWLNILNADSASLVFSSFYIDAPASMYGHTLLKVNSKHETENLELLDYSINYAANVGDIDPFRYALYGMIGWHKGTFAVLPYHAKVREYAQLENRDLWEYRLGLSKPEIDRMLLHLWEAGHTFFYYYYMTENCSYQLLSLLEAARPELRLTDQFFWWVFPGETIRLIAAQQGLVSKLNYRPSLYSKVRQRLASFSESERKLFFGILYGEREPVAASLEDLSAARRPLFVDTLLSTMRYHKETDEQNEAMQKRHRQLLLLRTTLSAIAEKRDYLPLSSPPETGHDIFLTRLGGGVANTDPFVELQLRPQFHGVLDRPRGHSTNAEFRMLDLRLRYFPNEGRTELYRVSFLRLLSLSPYNFITRSKSYLADLGVTTEVVEKPGRDPLTALLAWRQLELTTNEFQRYFLYREYLEGFGEKEFERVPVGNLELAFGLTLQDVYGGFWSHFRASFLGGLRAQSSSKFETGGRAGPGARLVLSFDYGDFRTQLAGGYYGYDTGGEAVATLKIRYDIANNVEAGLEFSTQNRLQSGALSLLYFF